MTFSSKFYKLKLNGTGNNKIKGYGEIPICSIWFAKVLKADERVLVCSTVDKQIVDIIRKM